MKAFEMRDDDIYPNSVVRDVLAIKANLTARLSIIMGEYQANTLLGIPLGATQDEMDLHVQKIILGTDGVLGITEFSSTLVDKVYRCSFKADTKFGGLVYD